MHRGRHKTLCIQLDTNGDVLVVKGIGNGSKPVSAYVAEFLGGGYDFKAATGSSVVTSDGILALGLTEYGISTHAFDESTVFHRVRCLPGGDGKLGENDTCSDVTYSVPQSSQALIPAHVVPCLPQLAMP